MPIKNITIALLLIALPISGSTAETITVEYTNEEELRVEAISIIQKFGGALKPKLQAAIQSGGFENAIEICSVEAAQIANELSAQTGWNLSRVSLKPRNTDEGIADTYEQSILKQFDTRLATGESAATIASSGIAENRYRFMKAIPAEGLCLNCHGTNITPNISQAIAKYYPDDQATGYSLSQIRGAFSLFKSIENTNTD